MIQPPSHRLATISAALMFFGSAAVAQEIVGSPELEMLKKLEGRWEGSTDRGPTEAVVTYSVTGRGSAVVETLFPGTRREMTTVYHDDHNGHLVMTHYCNAGNQPLLSLVSASDNQLYFELSPDDRGIDVEHEAHAHELTITFNEDGTLVHDWLNWDMGEPAATRNIALVKSGE